VPRGLRALSVPSWVGGRDSMGTPLAVGGTGWGHRWRGGRGDLVSDFRPPSLSFPLCQVRSVMGTGEEGRSAVATHCHRCHLAGDCVTAALVTRFSCFYFLLETWAEAGLEPPSGASASRCKGHLSLGQAWGLSPKLPPPPTPFSRLVSVNPLVPRPPRACVTWETGAAKGQVALTWLR
jgi:hypothetical protein